MVAALEEHGMRENTVIVFTSDNGIYNGERGLAGKWLMHEESIRIPLLLVDPALPEARRGQRLDTIALTIDFAPTMLARAQLPIPKAMQGMNLLLYQYGAGIGDRDRFFYEHHFGNDRPAPIPANEGVRTTDWKYIRYLDREPLFEELYHLAEDPGEARNLAADPEHRDQLEAMRAEWERLRQAVR